MVGFDAWYSFIESGKLVAMNGTTSMPKIGCSFSWIESRISPIWAWPVATARLMSGALNSDALACTWICSLPPVAAPTAFANRTRFCECGLSAG